MFIPNNAYLNYDRTATAFTDPLPGIFPVESESLVGKMYSSDLHCEEFNLNFKQTNCLFKVLLYALPGCVLFWALLIWVCGQLWQYFGGGSIGTG